VVAEAVAVHSADWWTDLTTGWSASTDQGRGQLWQYRQGPHVAALSVRAVEGVGQELVLRIDGAEVRSARFAANEQGALAAELARALDEGRRTCDALRSAGSG
jgi:hypothetical protein